MDERPAGADHPGVAVSGFEVTGFDVPVVEGWMGEHTRVVPPCTWRRLEGGHSNLTYELTDASGAQYVIRRPPQGDLLPKAHDMQREFRIIDALHPVGVPVAEPIGFCDDRAVCERHFYVMGKVGGDALYTAEQTAPRLDEAARGRVGESFMAVLAHLHSIDPVDVGLGELGRHDGYVARQLRTWYGSWTASAGRGRLRRRPRARAVRALDRFRPASRARREWCTATTASTT